MSLIDLDISSSYETNNEVNVLEDFYIPVLSSSVSYDRLSGYYSSSSIGVCAKGIAGLIKNNGKMRLITSPYLTKEDYNSLIKNNVNLHKCLETKILDDLSNIEDEFEKDHVQAMCWMIAKGFLDIKIAINKNYDNAGLLHQKVGILTDENNNQISFSGSNNETASGWLYNSEEFKVFRSWIPEQLEYLKSDSQKFNEIWNKQRDNIEVFSLSYSLKHKLIKIGSEFNKETFLKKYLSAKKKKKVIEDFLFPYQKDAVDKWIKNDYKLLFEMATGTGKTYTALGCLSKILNLNNKIITIISTPQSTLSKQWKNSIDELEINFDETIFADSSNRNWRSSLNNAINKIIIGRINNLVIYTTHSTSHKKDFIDLFKNLKSSIKVCFIGDEAHGFGASKNRQALLPNYYYRIGLSATPKRWFDDLGTNIVQDYFGNNSYEFTIKDALININPITGKTFLTNYKYFPIFVSLNDSEIEDYKKLSNRISKLYSLSKNDPEFLHKYEQLLFYRANIIKNAQDKYIKLDQLLNLSEFKDTIIFVSDKQLDTVLKMVSKKGIRIHRYTKSQKSKPDKKYGGISEREYIIKKFKKREIEILAAIKCLDEGIDIPSASTAVLMANSTNPREYIQRIGRIIRSSPNKKMAYVYDFVVLPSIDKLENRYTIKFEQEIFEKELIRVEDMSKNAINNSEVYAKISQKRSEVFCV